MSERLLAALKESADELVNAGFTVAKELAKAIELERRI